MRHPIVIVLATLVAAAAGAAGDVFDFIPHGGRTLLAAALASKPAPADAQALTTGKRTRDEWLAWLKSRHQNVAGLRPLDDKALLTLADYLAFNMPLAAGKAPAQPTQANWEKALPPDGRDFALERCQGCHIITVVVTQHRTKEAWLGTMGKPSHVQIKLSAAQREALANYLVINAGIPIDEVPEELRAGGATY